MSQDDFPDVTPYAAMDLRAAGPRRNSSAKGPLSDSDMRVLRHSCEQFNAQALWGAINDAGYTLLQYRLDYRDSLLKFLDYSEQLRTTNRTLAQDPFAQLSICIAETEVRRATLKDLCHQAVTLLGLLKSKLNEKLTQQNLPVHRLFVVMAVEDTYTLSDPKGDRYAHPNGLCNYWPDSTYSHVDAYDERFAGTYLTRILPA